MFNVCLDKYRWRLLSASLRFPAPIRSQQPHASSCTTYTVLGWPHLCVRRLRHCASCAY